MAVYSHNALDVTPLMTSANTPSPCVVTADHEDTGYEAWRAFDHSSASLDGWRTTEGYSDAHPASVVFDLGDGNAKVVTSYSVTSFDDAWKAWTIYGSNDNSNWTQLDTQGPLTWVAGEGENYQSMRTYSFANTTAYRYYKLTQTRYDSYGGFQEIEFLGAPPAPDINANINLSDLLSIVGTLMRGKSGDVESAISIPLSFNAEMAIDNTGIRVDGSIPLPLSFGATINTYLSYQGRLWGVLPGLSVYGEALAYPCGSGEIFLPELIVYAEGTMNVLGVLSQDIPLIDILKSEGLVYPIGVAHLTIPMFRFAGSLIESILGRGSVAIPMLHSAAATFSSVIGAGAVTIPMLNLYARIAEIISASMVLNLKTSSLTKFENYLFNSMCHFQGKNLGATATGINDLDLGTTDNGAIIDWNFKLGHIDLHMKTKKKLRQAWLSCQISGNLIVTVIGADGEEYEYTATSYVATEDGVRVKFGKGIRSKYVSIDVKNDESSVLELDAIRLNLDACGGLR